VQIRKDLWKMKSALIYAVEYMSEQKKEEEKRRGSAYAVR